MTPKRDLFLNLLLSLSFSANATTFAPITLPEAVKQSPLIFRGKVVGSRSEWMNGPDGHRRIYTDTQIDVTESFRGKIDSPITLREIGGEADGIGLEVPGRAQYSPGEDVVIFGTPIEGVQGVYRTRNMGLGKYAIVQDEDGKDAIQGADADRVPLEDLRKLVKSLTPEASTKDPANSTIPKEQKNDAQLRQTAPMATISESEAGDSEGLPVPLALTLAGIALGIMMILIRRRR